MLNQNYINWRVFSVPFLYFIFFSSISVYIYTYSIYIYVYTHSVFTFVFQFGVSLCFVFSLTARLTRVIESAPIFWVYTRASWKPLIIIVVQLAVVPRMEAQWEGWFLREISDFLAFSFLSLSLFYFHLSLSRDLALKRANGRGRKG